MFLSRFLGLEMPNFFLLRFFSNPILCKNSNSLYYNSRQNIERERSALDMRRTQSGSGFVVFRVVVVVVLFFVFFLAADCTPATETTTTTTTTNNGNNNKRRRTKNGDDEQLSAAASTLSRHLTLDVATGAPRAVSPVLLLFDDESNGKEEEEENPAYEGYYCPRETHEKCEDTDSPEKYHGVDAWTIDEAFAGVAPPENVPMSTFDASRVPSSWTTLGVREDEGETILKEALRRRRRGESIRDGGRRRTEEKDDDDDDDDEKWTSEFEYVEEFYDDKDGPSMSQAAFAGMVEEALNGAVRVLKYHNPKMTRARRSAKYKNANVRSEISMRTGIEQRFGNLKTVTLDFMENLISSKETKSPMEVYIELVQVANCFRARGGVRDADYATDAFELALIARDVARTPNVEVYLFYGEFKTHLNELPEAKKLLREGIKHDSHNQPLYFALGNVCASQGQFEDAVKAFGKAVELAPGHKTSIEALEAAKKKAIGSHRRMYATYCLLLMAVLACLSMISFLMANSNSDSKEKKAKGRESKKRK